MNTIKLMSFICLALILGTACSNDDDAPPVPVNEEEVITSVLVSLVAPGETVTLESRDLDGDGPNPPQLNVSGNLKSGVTYTGTVRFLDETETPAEDITLEVVEEGEEHQVFFIPRSGLQVTTTYGNNDANGNPIGTEFTLDAGAASSGTFTVVLRHEPNKPNDGTLADAGGETDVTATFDVTVE